MNDLSWFLYYADVVPRISKFFVFVGIILAIFYAARAAFSGAEEFPFQGVASGRVNPKHRLFAIALVLFFLTSLVPSKQTIYLIAASEASEVVVTSEVGQQTLLDIQEILQHQLDSLKPEVPQ
jgi:amino acid transporter